MVDTRGAKIENINTTPRFGGEGVNVGSSRALKFIRYINLGAASAAAVALLVSPFVLEYYYNQDLSSSKRRVENSASHRLRRVVRILTKESTRLHNVVETFNLKMKLINNWALCFQASRETPESPVESENNEKNNENETENVTFCEAQSSIQTHSSSEAEILYEKIVNSEDGEQQSGRSDVHDNDSEIFKTDDEVDHIVTTSLFGSQERKRYLESKPVALDSLEPELEMRSTSNSISNIDSEENMPNETDDDKEDHVKEKMNPYALQQAVIEAVSFLKHSDSCEEAGSSNRWIAIIAAPCSHLSRFESVLNEIAATESVPLIESTTLKMALMRGSIVDEEMEDVGSIEDTTTVTEKDTSEDTIENFEKSAWANRSARFKERLKGEIEAFDCRQKQLWKLRSARFRKYVEAELEALVEIKDSSDEDDSKSDFAYSSEYTVVDNPIAISIEDLKERSTLLQRRITEELEAMETGTYNGIFDAETFENIVLESSNLKSHSGMSIGESLSIDALSDAELKTLPSLEIADLIHDQFDEARKQLAITLDGLDRRRNESTLSTRAEPLRNMDHTALENDIQRSEAPELSLGDLLVQAGRQLELLRSQLEDEERRSHSFKQGRDEWEEKCYVLQEKYQLKEVENQALANRINEDKMNELECEITTLRENLEQEVHVSNCRREEIVSLQSKVSTYQRQEKEKNDTLLESAELLDEVRKELQSKQDAIEKLEAAIVDMNLKLKESHQENMLLTTQAEAAASLAKRAIGTVKSLSSVVSIDCENVNNIEADIDGNCKHGPSMTKANEIPKELVYLKNLANAANSSSNKFSVKQSSVKQSPAKHSQAKGSPAKDMCTSSFKKPTPKKAPRRALQ